VIPEDDIRTRGDCNYGGVIKRTGTGDVPMPPTTGGAVLGLVLQPTTLRTVIWISPGFAATGTPARQGFAPSEMQSIKACRKPRIVTSLPPGGTTGLTIGIVTMELLVVTFLLANGLLVPAIIVRGLVGHVIGSSVSCP